MNANSDQIGADPSPDYAAMRLGEGPEDIPPRWLLLHGFTGTRRDWSVWPADGAPALAIDLPGHGDSPDPGGPLEEEIARLLSALPASIDSEITKVREPPRSPWNPSLGQVADSPSDPSFHHARSEIQSASQALTGEPRIRQKLVLVGNSSDPQNAQRSPTVSMSEASVPSWSTLLSTRRLT